MDSVLKCHNIKKWFDNVPAVRGVSLSVSKGEFFALLGPSGSGKTTMLRIIAGLETPSEGHVEIDGKDVTRLPPYKREIGMVFQDFLLFPHKTIGENITFPLKMRNLTESKQKEQLNWVLNLMHMEGFEERYPHMLSAGQKQRISLARGLVAQPKVLLLDEPLANLDLELRKEMEVELRRYQLELQMPFIYVTHNQEEALTMSDQIAVMNNGIFEQVGSKIECYSSPSTSFVASFVGSANFIKGSLISIANNLVQIKWKGLELKIPKPENLQNEKTIEYYLKYEYVQIRKTDMDLPDNSDYNLLKGRLRDIIFKGQLADYFIILENGEELVASESYEIKGINIGDNIEIIWESHLGNSFIGEN